MRALWITNGPTISKHREMLNISASQGGGWLVAAYEAMRDSNEVTLGIATTYIGKNIQEAQDGKHSFYLVPCPRNAQDYNQDLQGNIDAWKEIIKRFDPDVIQVWGTEFPYGICALKAAQGIPSVVYIQGLMAQIANHGDGQISFRDKLKSTTVADILKRKTYWHQRKEYTKRVSNEREMLALASGIIVENGWCADNCRLMMEDCRVFKSLLPINKAFSECDWSYEKCEKHTLFTTAGPDPIKGHHQLFKALAIVKKHYPDVKLHIPGLNYYFEDSLARKIKRHSYAEYLLSLIGKYDLAENITFVGSLTQKQMAENMALCNVFVMPSAIENHSSTLLEAMMVGAPTVASNVGGVEEYCHNGVNGLLYRYDEPEVMAANIIKLFDDPELAARIGQTAKQGTRDIRLNINLESDFIACYKTLISEQ